MGSKLTDFLGVVHNMSKNVDPWKKIEIENYSFFTLRFSTEKKRKNGGKLPVHFFYF